MHARILRLGASLLGAVAFAAALSSSVWSQDLVGAPLQSRKLQTVRLVVGKSLVLQSPTPLRRASLANPGIADFLILSPDQLYVMGKTIGITNLTVWSEKGTVSGVYEVEVSPDVTRLKEQLHQLLPTEKHIQVTSSHDNLTLTGAVTSVAHVSQALALAEAFAPKKVINLLQVEGVQQVMLEVRVAEMERTLLRRLGVNLAYTGGKGGAFAVTTLKGQTTPLNSADTSSVLSLGPLGMGVSQAINSLFRFQAGSLNWTGFIDALKENNLVKILAEPTLTALSGQNAHFLAGGEFPIPVPQAFGVTTVQYKQFGVQLTFQPVVHSQNTISMTVTPEVSELDFANGLQLNGFTVPSITTRRASTTIEMNDGQSFAIAGLLRDTVRETIAKYPLLGDIPILGALFRSSQFQKNESELIIIVTPHLAKPMASTAPLLPTSRFVEPDDFDFYLMGRLQSLNQVSVERLPPLMSRTIERKLEGPVGHMAP